MASLLLAGLGSLNDPLAADPVLELAVRLAGLGLDAWPGFWLEEPTLAEATRGCGDVAHVLPVLAAEDYFSRALIPREVEGQANGRRVVLHRPLGARAAFTRLAASRVAEAGGPLARALVRPADDRASRRAAAGLAARLASALQGGAVLAEGDLPTGPDDVWLPVRVRGGWFADASDVKLPDGAPRAEAPWRARDLVSMVAGLTREFVGQSE
ncbi:MAG TPA: hypothetical protein VHN99_02620, partial [Deinococcales bacterium]|nr:hypothetical protein [Deinococcales bacterium]